MASLTRLGTAVATWAADERLLPPAAAGGFGVGGGGAFARTFAALGVDRCAGGFFEVAGFEREDLVAEQGGALELEARGGGGHLLLQLGDDGGDVLLAALGDGGDVFLGVAAAAVVNAQTALGGTLHAARGDAVLEVVGDLF